MITTGPRRGSLRRALAQLGVTVLLTYGLGLLGSVLVANAVRGLVGVEVDLLTPTGQVAPTWVGVLAYAQGATALAAVALLAAAALLAGTVEVTRSARRGEKAAPWTPFRRGLPRVPAVARGLAVVLPLAAAVLLLSVVLLVLSVVVVPVAAVVALVAWRRPALRRTWMRRSVVAATPLGLVAAAVVRWALWLPFVVVDGAGVRGALRHSAAAASGRVVRTARPLALVAVVSAMLAALLVGASAAGVPVAVVGVGAVLLLVGLLVAVAVVATVLHEDVAPAVVVPRQRTRSRSLRRLAPSPVLTLALILGLLSQSAWWAPSADAALPTAGVTVVVNSLDDALDPTGQCASDSATCTVRAAVETAPAGATITFDVSGTIELVGTLAVRQSLTIDGAGQRVTLRSPPAGTALLLGAGQTGEGAGDETGGMTEPTPGAAYVLRNLSFRGAYADGHGIIVGSGSATVENATFTRHKTLDSPGSALYASNGDLTVINSTFVDNSAMTAGGTVASSPSFRLSVNASTFVGNHGGGVRAASATVTNSLFRGASGGFNCDASATVGGNVSNDGSCADAVAGASDPSRTNLTDAQLALGTVSDNGGPVDTVPLRAGSAAIGAGTSTTPCPSHDARGQARGGSCDAGAYQTTNGTTTTIAASQNPARFGSPITVTVTVANPQGTPTGTVELTGTPAGTQTAPLTAGTGIGVGTATFTLTPSVGSHPLRATYVPSAGLTASTGSLDLVVEAQSSATELQVTPAGSSAPGTPVTLTATVRNGGDVRHAQPTGSVDFASGGTALGSGTIAGGVATWTGQLPLGANALTAVYVPSNGFLTSTGTATHSVQSVSSVTVDAPTTVVHGAPFTLTASLPVGATGRVVFHGRTTDRVWSSAPVTVAAGTATTRWTQVLAPGQWTFTAEYSGDASNASGFSPPATTTVAPAATGVVLTGPIGTTTSGQPAPFTATVDAKLTPAVPTGSVELRADGTRVASAVLVDGVASFAPTGIPVGTDRSLVATYLPDDAGFTTSASSVVPHTVTRGSTTTGLAAPATSASGESVVLVATVAALAPATAAPAGIVTFSADGTDVGSAPLVDGVASLTTTALPVGATALTATFAATSELAASTSSAVQHAVSRSATTVALTSDKPAPAPGQPLTLTATVSVTAPGSGSPTGSVVFRDGATLIGTVPVSGGAAVLHLGGLTGGVHALTATYAGDTRLTGSDGALTVTVAKVAAYVTIRSVSPEPSRFGSPVTVVASVRGATGLPVTGDVELTWGGAEVVGRAPVVDGVATFTVDDLSPGNTVLSAQYLGDVDHVGASTPTGPDSVLTWHRVLRAAPTVRLSSEPGPTAFGGRVRVYADVTPAAGRVPTGAVRFTVPRSGEVTSARFDAAGRAFADVTPTATGSLYVSVSVDSDHWFDPLFAEGEVHEVVAGAASVRLTSVGDAVVDRSVLLLATVGPDAARGVGFVRFLDGGTELGAVRVDDLGRAALWTTFTTKGVHDLTAVFEGGTFFGSARSAVVPLAVTGRTARFGMLQGGSSYGDAAALTTYLTGSGQDAVSPTGTVSVLLGERVLGTAALAPAPAGAVLTTAVPLGRGLEPGTYAVTVAYSGDAVHEPLSAPATFVVEKRRLAVELDALLGPVAAGQVVRLSGRLRAPAVAAGVLPPTGTLQLGRSLASCTVDGLDGTCTTTFPGFFEQEQLTASYSGDSRYEAVTSPVVRLEVLRTRLSLELSTSPQASAWNDTEPGTVTWSAASTTTAPVQGPLEVWTSEGRQFDCPTTATGSCTVRFAAASTSAWVELRYAGDAAHLPSSRRLAVPVRGCHDVRALSGGRVLTAPNCGGTKYLFGTAVSFEAPVRPGFTFLGWATDRTPGTVLQPSPLAVGRDLVVEPRYQPVCFTLSVTSYPAFLRAVTPFPAPNCDDAVQPDFTVRDDVAAIAQSEVERGSMRYRVGTRVQLPNYSERLTPTMLGPVRWSGEGVSPDGVLTVQRDVELVKRLSPPCHRFVVDGPPGATTSITGSTFDDGGNPLLDRNLGGTCERSDGSRGYLPGTSLRVALTPETGTWFERWGDLEPLSTHRAPTAPAPAAERPADITRVGRTATTTVVVPDRDAAMSGFTSAVTCHRLDVTVQDAVSPGQLRVGDKPASVSTTAANCPSWWLVQKAVPSAEHARWYLAGTDVTLTASGDTRMGTVDEFVHPKQIYFRGWSGAVTGDALVQQVRMDGPVAATARWYVSARCAGVTVRAVPAGSGEVILSDLGTECPKFQSMFAGVAPVPQAPLGSTVSLAARPTGALQVIWKVEGRSTTSTQACLTRERYIQEQYDLGYEAGRSKAAIDRALMVNGYLPGLTVSRIQEEAADRHAAGWTQAGIVDYLKQLGLLLPSGAVAPDRLRENPCERTEVSTVHRAGQRGVVATVEGSMTYTAHFCQAVDPSVTIIGLDGTSAAATPGQLAAFGTLFRSSNTAGNCPTPGWFYPGTTAELGAAGTGVTGYVLKGWTLDGAAQPAGPLSVPISATGAPRAVAATVQVVCHKLTVKAEFGSTAYPLPNCPGADASRGLYAEGTKVTVTAGASSGHVLVGWHETASSFNPTLAVLDQPRTLTANFRAKTTGEVIMDSVIDPALDAAGIAAKKAVGGIALTIKVVGDQLIDGALLGTLSALGTALKEGFAAIGVQGVVLDHIALTMQIPENAFQASFAGFDCVQEWAWGTSLPSLGDLKDTVTATVKGEVKAQVAGVEVDTVLAEAQLLAAKMAAGDPAVLAQAYITAAGGGPAVMVVHLALDISENPGVWEERATAAAEGAGAYALDLLAEEFGTGFTWESSATEAWTTGGDAFLNCMAKNGRAIAGA